MRFNEMLSTRPASCSDLRKPLWVLLLIGFILGGFLGCSGGATPSIGTNPVSSPAAAVQDKPTELKGHEMPVVSLAFSRDSATLASGSMDKTARLWDLAAGKEKRSIEHPAGHVFAVAWTAEGKLVTTSGDAKQNGELTWWDPASGVSRKKISVTKGLVRGLGVSADGEKIAWGKGGTLEVLSSGVDDQQPPLASYNNQVGGATYIAFSKDGKQLLYTCMWGAQLWTIDPAGKPKQLKGPDDPTGVGFDPKGNCLISSEREVVAVVDPTTGNLIENIRGLGFDAYGAAVTPDGKYIVSGVLNGVRFYDPKTHEEVGRVTVPDGVDFVANSVAISPDGSKVAAGGGKTVRKQAKNYSIFVWNTSSMAPPPSKK